MSDWDGANEQRRVALQAQREASGRANEHEFRRSFGMGFLSTIIAGIVVAAATDLDGAYWTGRIFSYTMLGAVAVAFIARGSHKEWPLWWYFMSMLGVAALSALFGILVMGGATESAGSPESSVPTPASNETATLTQPELVIAWPDGWREVPLKEVRTQLAGQAEQVPAEFKATFRELVQQIDDGVIVAQATGPVVNGTHAPSILVSVESNDRSLLSAAKRREDFLRVLTPGMDQQIDERSPVVLPVSRAMRIRAHSNPPIGIPSQTIEYVLLLDQSTVSIFGTAPTEYTEFVDVMATVADELSRP